MVVKSIIKSYKNVGGAKIFSRKFVDFLKETADPVQVAVLMEDLVALFGALIALTCLLIANSSETRTPDCVGSILIARILFLTQF